MKLYEFDTKIKPGVISDISKDSLDGEPFDVKYKKVIDFVQQNCKTIIEAYKRTHGRLYHGTTMTVPPIFLGRSKTYRPPVDTPRKIQTKADSLFRGAGFKALRSNSIYTSPAFNDVKYYCNRDENKIYVIFPIDGFDFTWSPKIRDFAGEFDLASESKDSAADTMWTLNSFKPEEFVAEYMYHNNNDLDGALIYGQSEILIHGKYVAIKHSLREVIDTILGNLNPSVNNIMRLQDIKEVKDAMCTCGHKFSIHSHPPDFGCPHENDPGGGCGCKGATEITESIIPEDKDQEIIDLIQDNCSDILKIYHNTEQRFLRGLKNSKHPYIIGQSPINRIPLDTPKRIQKQFDLLFQKAGFVAVRHNSIFMSRRYSTAEFYSGKKYNAYGPLGSVYIVFPFDGYDATWSSKVKDFTYFFDLLKKDRDLDSITGFAQVLATADPHKWTEQYDYHKNDLWGAINIYPGTEVMLHGKYILVNVNQTNILDGVMANINIQESSSGGTSSGAIATVNAPLGGSPREGQFFGGDPNSSIYAPIKKHRKARKEDIEEEKAISILGSKPRRNPKALGPTEKVASEGPILGKPPGKKNTTLSKKFFGCSKENNIGSKRILGEDEIQRQLNYNEFHNALKATNKVCPVCNGSFRNVHDANQKYCCPECDVKGSQVSKLKEAFDNHQVRKAGFIPYYIDNKNVTRFLFVISSDPAYGGTAPMVAKGHVDAGENEQQAALREGNEECGLRQNNLMPSTVKVGWKGEITGMTESSPMTIFIGQVKDPSDFDKPGFEVAKTLWMTAQEFSTSGRKSQNFIVQACAKAI